MKITTLKNINRKSSFQRIAEAATVIAKANKVLVRFEMGPAAHRRVFVAGPNKSVHTLVWEWAKSVPGMMVATASRIRKPKAVATVEETTHAA